MALRSAGRLEELRELVLAGQDAFGLHARRMLAVHAALAGRGVPGEAGRDAVAGRLELLL
jgi:hypothetical protein